MLLVHSYTVSLLEIPNEISLCLNISGCPCNCKGCSEPYLQENIGEPLSIDYIKLLLEKYKNYNLTCICFMGGDKEHDSLKEFFSFLSLTTKNLKLAFYSGFDFIDLKLVPFLNYYKIGRFIMPTGDQKDWYKKSCGPINFPWSNQKLFKIQDSLMLDITEEFRKNPISDLERYIVKSEDIQ